MVNAVWKFEVVARFRPIYLESMALQMLLLTLLKDSPPVVEWVWDVLLHTTSGANVAPLGSCHYGSPISTCVVSSAGFDFYVIWQNPSPSFLHCNSRFFFCLSTVSFVNGWNRDRRMLNVDNQRKRIKWVLILDIAHIIDDYSEI